MKKRLTQKILAAFVVAMLFSFGASAQVMSDYVSAESAAAEAIDTVTVNSTTRLYALPDPVFSPGYDPTDGTGRGADQRWTWTGEAAKAVSAENWTSYTWGATGNFSTTVVESNANFSCVDAGKTITTEVIDAPTAIFTVANGTPVFGTGATHSYCETDPLLATDSPQLTFTDEITGSPSFLAQYTVTVDTNMNGDATWGNIAGLTDTYSAGAGTAVATNSLTVSLAAPVNATGFVCITNTGVDYPTRYTYTLNGVNDRISRKCDFEGNWIADAGINYGDAYTANFSNWTWYSTGATIVITVNPTPVTGPIYHISNTWAN